MLLVGILGFQDFHILGQGFVVTKPLQNYLRIHCVIGLPGSTASSDYETHNLTDTTMRNVYQHDGI